MTDYAIPNLFASVAAALLGGAALTYQILKGRGAGRPQIMAVLERRDPHNFLVVGLQCRSPGEGTWHVTDTCVREPRRLVIAHQTGGAYDRAVRWDPPIEIIRNTGIGLNAELLSGSVYPAMRVVVDAGLTRLDGKRIMVRAAGLVRA